MLGVSAVYLLFTLSRTGYLAVAGMGVILIPVMCLSMKQGLRCTPPLPLLPPYLPQMQAG